MHEDTQGFQRAKSVCEGNCIFNTRSIVLLTASSQFFSSFSYFWFWCNGEKEQAQLIPRVSYGWIYKIFFRPSQSSKGETISDFEIPREATLVLERNLRWVSLSENWKKIFCLDKIYLAVEYYILLQIYHTVVTISELNIWQEIRLRCLLYVTYLYTEYQCCRWYWKNIF